MSISYCEESQVFTLSGGDVSYVLQIMPKGQLLNLYWGKRVPDGSVTLNPADYPGFLSFDIAESWLPHEVPTLGGGWYGTPAVGVVNANGDHVTRLVYAAHRVYKGKRPLEGLPAVYTESDDEADSLEIDLADALTCLRVTLCYTMFSRTGVLARSMNVKNAGTETLELTEAMASVPLFGKEYDVVHLKGAWARERGVVRTPVGEGEYRVFSQRGASGHEENPFLALCERGADEARGGVWAVNFLYSGSFLACAHVNNANNTRLSIGMNPQTFAWRLEQGESFQMPEAVLCYSDNGFNGMSRMYHECYRTRLVRGAWRDRVRPILINNWEATYFDFNQERIVAIAKQASTLGIELFVLDDGWFGKRDNDQCSLGDWTPNTRKLPGGLAGLSREIHNLGMMFGLWLEPEMVSPDSDLYRAHPDWCLHAKGRERTLERYQLVLDMSRECVQDYVTETVCRVLRESGADYIKWDMNRNMTEYFSGAQVPERQKETQHRYILGLYRVLESVTHAFPDVLFESCSGGGGRFDGGMLYYMPQTWTSDNTDAVARLSIQYGTSFAYPVSAMGAHVSAVPNHQNNRTTSLKMRGDVALAGNFGFELDLTKLPEDDLRTIAAMVDNVKSLRELTQKGRFIRLLSPGAGQHAAWMFVSSDQSEALLCVYQALAGANLPPIRVKLAGLAGGARYLADDGQTYSADVLENMGYTASFSTDFESMVVRFSRV